MVASSWRRTGLYTWDRQSFWFIYYSHQEDNVRNNRTLANGKFESQCIYEPWSKVYRCSHFFTILCLAISSKWTWNPLKSWSLPATNPKNNELVIELVILSNCKFIPALKVLWLVHFSKRRQKYPHHLFANKSKKKDIREKKLEENMIGN